MLLSAEANQASLACWRRFQENGRTSNTNDFYCLRNDH